MEGGRELRGYVNNCTLFLGREGGQGEGKGKEGGGMKEGRKGWLALFNHIIEANNRKGYFACCISVHQVCTNTSVRYKISQSGGF